MGVNAGNECCAADIRRALALYRAASQLHDAPSIDDQLVWANAVSRVDVSTLIAIGKEVRDPMPFVPLLRVVMAMRLVSDSVELERAEAHLRAESQRVLDALGLSMLRPDDVLRRTPPLLKVVRNVVPQRA